MKPFVFELKLSWRGFYGNLLEWIPRIHVFISDNPSINLQWMCMDLSLWCGILKNIGKGFYLTPCLVFKKLNKKYKEKYDFQFSWFNISYRKFIGERTKYETILAEELKNPINWEEILSYCKNTKDKNIIDFSKYDEFIAEQYEKEDEFYKELIEELDADYYIHEF